MIKRLAGTIAALTLVAAITSLGMSRSLAAADSMDLLAKPFGAMDSCLDCSICGGDGHKAFTGDETSRHQYGVGPHTDCWETGDCGLQHPATCGISFASLTEALEGVRNAVAGEDAGALEHLLAENELVHFEAARSAIQVVGCQGTVVAHFPVNDAMFASLNH